MLTGVVREPTLELISTFSAFPSLSCIGQSKAGFWTLATESGIHQEGNELECLGTQTELQHNFGGLFIFNFSYQLRYFDQQEKTHILCG